MPLVLTGLTTLWALATRWQFISGLFAGNVFSIFKKKQSFWETLSLVDVLALAGALVAFALVIKQLRLWFK